MATRKKTTEAPVTPMTPKEIADKLRAKFIVAATAVANDAVADQVAESIIADLNAQKRAVTLSLLGLTDKWGKYEVESRESPITKHLTEAARATVMQWVNDAVVEVLTEERKVKVKNTVKNALKARIEGIVKDNVHDYNIQKKAEAMVETMLQKAADEVRDELGLEFKVGVK
jgi:uncharacterized membrane-anchored protein YjiN (DUF445 family)